MQNWEMARKPSTLITALKRALDIVTGLTGTTAFVLAYPILAIGIKLQSPGPVLYLQSRVGLDKRSRREGPGSRDSRRKQDVGGAVFTIFKFRTMRMDSEVNGPQLCNKHGDARVTPFGRFLRSTHLDELPQFWNVLKGEMSFIGPRPERPHFTVKYFEKIPLYRERTRKAKPGLTGLAQITLGYDDSLESVIRKTHFDLAYRDSLFSLTEWLRMETWILINTFRYLIGQKPQRANALVPTYTFARTHNPPGPPVRTILPHSEPIANFLTIDVECWFHAHNLAVPRADWEASPTNIVANVGRILSLLEAHQSKATFFVLGWVADKYPEVVRMIDAAGHEIGTHGYYHDRVTDLSPYQFEKDLEMSLNSLARLTGQKIRGHRASNFSIVKSTLWALEILERHGIDYDSSIFPIARKRYGIPDYPNPLPHIVNLGNGACIKEIPLSTMEWAGQSLPISGGGYLRLYPYGITKRFMQKRNQQGLPGMIYFHPWELDINQERRKVGLLKSFQHYVNLDTTEWKISRLLENFRLTSIKECLETQPIQTLLHQNPVQLAVSGVQHPATSQEPFTRETPSSAKDFENSRTGAVMQWEEWVGS
jgi:polysaccharide deacetylase family protein (PEP-CTERM system associated)